MNNCFLKFIAKKDFFSRVLEERNLKELISLKSRAHEFLNFEMKT